MYIGPDAMMPIVSAIATVMAAVVAFWHRIHSFFAARFGRKDPGAQGPGEPS
jgi:hypothetical protein